MYNWSPERAIGNTEVIWNMVAGISLNTKKTISLQAKETQWASSRKKYEVKDSKTHLYQITEKWNKEKNLKSSQRKNRHTQWKEQIITATSHQK